MSSPSVLIIDDHVADERAKFVVLASTLKMEFRHPQDVTSDDLEDADVVVVDFKLDDDWQQRDELQEIALKPMNGLAVVSVLQSHERRLDGSPTAFVLRSAHLSDLSPEFAADTRLHVIARQNNLDWVLNKDAELATQTLQIESLANATSELPEAWPSDNSERLMELVQGWLGLGQTNWRQLAWQDVEDCHPPIHELAERKHGLRLVRWMTQRILPYPCFLWTTARLATRLRVTGESLQAALLSGLAQFLELAQYVGALKEFDGDVRWWRSGLESVLWELTEGRSFDTELTRELLNQRCQGQLVAGDIQQPVLCLDREFQIRAEPCDLADVVRVQPDDWPVYADQAWAAVSDALDEPRLAAATISVDREKLTNRKTREDS